MPQNCHLYLAFDAHTLEKICENTSNLNSTSCPTFDWAHLDGLALGPAVFRVPPVQSGVMMTNIKPPKGLRASPQLHRIHSDPIKDMFADFLATRLCVGRRRLLLEPDKIVTASRLYRLPEQV